MSWTEVINGIGGVGGIIGGISAWLALIWANRILQKEKASQNKQLELFRTSLESIKAHNNKFTSVQFEAYNTLWCALVDVNTCADDLWDSASRENLITFNKSLRKASALIQKSRIFLEDQHYRQLREIMSVFTDYESGKQKLFSIRSENDLQDKSMDKLRRELDQIENNSFFRQSYKSLLDQIADSLKTQLGLKAHL
ncbi:MAG: hypothetical protein V3V47_04295 [Desulfobacteria bacterium]